MQEYYADFTVHSPQHFSVPIPSVEAVYNPKSLVTSGYEIVDRLVQGLSAVFLAIRRRPVIRYQSGSEYAMRVAESLYGLTYKQVKTATKGSSCMFLQSTFLMTPHEFALYHILACDAPLPTHTPCTPNPC